jgi:hypothetical protein
MWHHFKLLPFIVGILVGGVVFFYLRPDIANAEKVVKWPHPDNAGKIVYRDRNGLCYTFEAQLADCGTVKESLTTYAFE